MRKIFREKSFTAEIGNFMCDKSGFVLKRGKNEDFKYSII